MITPIHIVFDLGIYTVLKDTGLVEVNNRDLFFLFSAQLIDLDHLFSRPIFMKRNPFKAHFLHRHWPVVFGFSLAFLVYRPLLFLGIGLLSHMFLDLVYVKLYDVKVIGKFIR